MTLVLHLLWSLFGLCIAAHKAVLHLLQILEGVTHQLLLDLPGSRTGLQFLFESWWSQNLSNEQETHRKKQPLGSKCVIKEKKNMIIDFLKFLKWSRSNSLPKLNVWHLTFSCPGCSNCAPEKSVKGNLFICETNRRASKIPLCRWKKISSTCPPRPKVEVTLGPQQKHFQTCVCCTYNMLTL